MKKTVIIHFLPLEYYPPITNLINYFNDFCDTENNIWIFSTKNTRNRKEYENNRFKIYKTKSASSKENSFFRLLKYLYFNFFVFLKLIIIKPENILYYETLSSFPAYLYNRFINIKSNVFIHYHEYTTPEQYRNYSMRIERFFHKLEQKFTYNRARWISQTNKDRLNLFYKDNQGIDKSILKELPNYPPKNWSSKVVTNEKKCFITLKCVYIGSLSFEDTYIKEFIEWVINQNGKIEFDIYSYNLHSETEEYLNCLNYKFINFNKEGIDYYLIPEIQKKYSVGLILYKGSSKNFEFNATNKLFEYLACNLDVWASSKLMGVKPYISYGFFPKIELVDFERMQEFDWQAAINKNSLQFRENIYCYESVYVTLKEAMGV